MTRPLELYSLDELLEEIVIRQNATPTARPQQWCDDCRQFQPWQHAGEAPARYNPCRKKHTMQFLAPVEIGDAWGHYRRVCADRAPRETTA